MTTRVTGFNTLNWVLGLRFYKIKVRTAKVSTEMLFLRSPVLEDAIVEVLVEKTARAAEECGAQTIIVGGGVSANSYLRSAIHARLSTDHLVLFPTPQLATDNARMIALAGYFHASRSEYADVSIVRAQGGLKIGAPTT